MDVFALRDRVVDEYQAYARGFISVKEDGIRQHVEDSFAQGRPWPEPLVQLNPSFEPGRSVDQLVQEGLLHRECPDIFRRRDHDGDIGQPILLHRHQDDAIQAAATGASYVLTTGTGSGKSLAYFIPIVDYVLRTGSGRGIKAIVAFPMNALYNSLEEALTRFLTWAYPGGKLPVTLAKYTSQEDEQKRNAIDANPPDTPLTDFGMLEFDLARGEDRYIPDPADVHGPDFPGETFRVLKERELREYGEYRTRRLVLEAWDRLGLVPRNRDGRYEAEPAPTVASVSGHGGTKGPFVRRSAMVHPEGKASSLPPPVAQGWPATQAALPEMTEAVQRSFEDFDGNIDE